MDATPTLTGRSIVLRAPQPSDVADRFMLGRNPEIVRLFGGSAAQTQPLTEEEAQTWCDEIAAATCSWIIEHTGRCIGSARLHGIDRRQGSAWYAVGILDATLLGRGLGREVTSLVLRYAFEDLALARVDLRVLDFNLRAIRSYEASGFSRSALEPAKVHVDGRWHDDLIMSISHADWESRRS